jgi:PhzF family phenazine biosynthesis protein
MRPLPPPSLPFHLVDVFADRPLHGNPLALVDQADGMSIEDMRAVAREFNQSETTFLLRPTQSGAERRLRSFTAAGAEVFGAGHNALGAWWWLAASGGLRLDDGVTTFGQEIGTDVLQVQVVSGAGGVELVAMRQTAPVAGTVVTDRPGLAAALGVADGRIGTGTLPCQVISTGASHLLVPVLDPDAVDACVPDATRLLHLLTAAGAEGCYVFSIGARHPHAGAYARFFNPTVGIVEDPATGSAAGPLAAHLSAHGRLAGHRRLVVEQGTAVGRRSLIDVTVDDHGPIVAGRAVVVASGRLTLQPG